LQTLSSKWVFKKKLKTDGLIDKFKARLVVKGSNQKIDVDYFNTYSLVIKVATMRALIAFA